MNVSEKKQAQTADADAAIVLSDLIDPDDFCRACRGTGGEDEKTERGTTLFEPCFLCRGTGQRTIRISSPQYTIAAE